MQITEFLDQYIEILRRGPARKSIEMILHRYYPVLQVKRDSEFIDIDNRLTLYTAGIKDGEQCQVRAQEHKHKNQPLFSLRASEVGWAAEESPTSNSGKSKGSSRDD